MSELQGDKWIEFNERLIKLMGTDLSYNQLSKAIGCTHNCVAWWVHGERYPSMKYIYRLAVFFDVSADYLLGLNERG